MRLMTCQQLGPVHMYLNIFESATFSFWIRLLSTHIQRILQWIWIFVDLLCSMEKKIRNESDNLWMVNLFFFFRIWWYTCSKILSSLLLNNKYGSTTCRPSFSRVNPDTIRCVWTGKLHLNTQCVYRNFWIWKEKVSGYLCMCGWGFNHTFWTCSRPIFFTG